MFSSNNNPTADSEQSRAGSINPKYSIQVHRVTTAFAAPTEITKPPANLNNNKLKRTTQNDDDDDHYHHDKALPSRY